MKRSNRSTATSRRAREYRAVLDDFGDADGDQMCLMHIDVRPHKFNPTVMKRLLDDWRAFRSVTDAPLYGIEAGPDDSKWERFVSLLGFQNTNQRVDCSGTAFRDVCS
jgi:hypothetical protein